MTARRIVLIGASGGVGTTVLAAALAARAAQRGVGTVVAERQRGGLDVVCGVDGWPGARLDDLTELEGDVDAVGLLAALPRPGGVSVLAHAADRPGPALDEGRLATVLAALADHVGLLVLDGGTGWVPQAGVHGAGDILLVVGPGPHQLARAAGLLPALDEAAHADHAIRVVLSRARTDAAVVAEQLGAAAGVHVGADASVERDLTAAAWPGRHGRGPLARGVDRLLDEVGVVGAGGRPGRRHLAGAR